MRWVSLLGLGVTLGALLCPVGASAESETPSEMDAGNEADAGTDSNSGVSAELGVAVPGDEVSSSVASFAITKLKDSPAVVTVITREEIRRLGIRDLVDALYLVPGFFFGVDVQGIVGPGFRGLWGYEGKILFLLDGKEMNELMYSTIQLGNEIPMDVVERIEVVRGPGSVIYGGNAELAVINVVTRGPQGSTDVMVSGNYGQAAHTYMRRNATVSGREVFDAIPGLSVFATASLGQGQRSGRNYVDDFGSSYSMAGNSALNPTLIQVGAGYRDFQASFLYHRYGTNGGDQYTALVAPTPPIPNTFDSYHADVSYTFRPSDRLEITPRLTFLYQEPWKDSDFTSSAFYDKQATRSRARLVARWAPVDFLQLTLGGDAFYDRASLNLSQLSLSNPLSDPLPGLQTRFVSPDNTNPGNNTISYTTFAAFIEAYSENPIVNIVAGARYDNNSYVGQSLVPRIVLLRSFGPFSAKAIFSKAFKVPGFENINSNLAIHPERTTVYELSAAYDITPEMRLSANVFDMAIQTTIVYSYNPATNIEVYQNLGREGSQGVELEYTYKSHWGRVGATYSFYRPNGTDIGRYEVPGHPESFLGAPAHRATLVGFLRILPWLSIGPSAVVLGPRYGLGAADPNTGVEPVLAIPTQVLVNVFLRAENVFGVRGFDIGLGGYNLLGTPYTYVQPYDGQHAPLPGLDREVMLNLSYLFEPN